MSESLQMTIVYERGEDGWVVASIPEVPGAHSQGRTREEAHANVIDALRGILELRLAEPSVFGPAPTPSLDVVSDLSPPVLSRGEYPVPSSRAAHAP